MSNQYLLPIAKESQINTSDGRSNESPPPSPDNPIAIAIPTTNPIKTNPIEKIGLDRNSVVFVIVSAITSGITSNNSESKLQFMFL